MSDRERRVRLGSEAGSASELIQLRVRDEDTGADADEERIRALGSAIREVVEGDVQFDRGTRGAYSTDASHYRQVPLGVVLPRTRDDVVEAMRICREHDVPVLGRGGGTSLAGQCCNVGVVFDFSRHMDRVLDIDPERRLARVQPGCVLDHLRDRAGEHGLTFGPDPATHNRCVMGGMIGNNSCGIHSVMAGRTEDNVHSLEVLTYDGAHFWAGRTTDDELERIVADGGRRGEIYGRLRDLRDRHDGAIRERFPEIPRRVSGYSLPALLPENGFHVGRALVGTESTCVLFLEAVVELVPDPPKRSLVVLGFPDMYEAADRVPDVLETGPVGLEGMDRKLVDFMRRKRMRAEAVARLPEGDGWLLVEYGADTQDEANGKAEALRRRVAEEGLAVSCGVYTDSAEQAAMWEVRESGLGATAFVPGERPAWPGWEDAAVRPENLGDYLREFRGLLDEYGYDAALYGHFGDACVHCRIDFEHDSRAGVDRYLAFVTEAADLVVRYGGSISGEHGDGQSRAALLERMYGEEVVGAFREFKSIWDPDGRMNPGKVVDPYTPDQNLRLGPDWAPEPLETTFRFPSDHFSFADATVRCVGVGACRRSGGGIMCPSYMVTKEEKHSTRGRARLLFEMVKGDVVTDGWRSEEVKEALDLCLSCKGCKGECPVDVDIATYKAEFLSHYWEGRIRPRAAYSMGLIHWWGRLGSRMPGLANWTMRNPLTSTALKWAGGIAGEREMPSFAPRPFRRWFAERGPGNPEGPEVILWADTFNDFFHPHVLEAGLGVLEDAGFRVRATGEHLCCGRPLYDFGMLDTAKRLLRRIVDEFRDDIRAGVPVVGMEPSCVATLRDELPMMFPDDRDARRLSQQTFTLSEFIRAYEDDFELPRVERRALVHGHCHHKSVLDWEAEQEVLEGIGLEVREPDTGCCGMAGAFGFEHDKYQVSMACGERVLLPEVRETEDDVLVMTDGFSCREQIVQATGRVPLHLAEVIRMGRGGGAYELSSELTDGDPGRRR